MCIQVQGKAPSWTHVSEKKNNYNIRWYNCNCYHVNPWLEIGIYLQSKVKFVLTDCATVQARIISAKASGSSLIWARRSAQGCNNSNYTCPILYSFYSFGYTCAFFSSSFHSTDSAKLASICGNHTLPFRIRGAATHPSLISAAQVWPRYSNAQLHSCGLQMISLPQGFT